MKMLKEEVKMSVFAADIVVFTGKLLKVIGNGTCLVDIGIITKFIAFLFINNKQL